MKEHPILMSIENVRAILEGRKTQTRRVIKPQPKILASHAKLNQFGRWDFLNDKQRECAFVCPYGQVGDTLWVRETFAYESPDGDRYVTVIPGETKIYYHATDDWEGVRVPSIHMPRWASRITLEITEIRGERLQEITPHDCVAEGIVEEYGDGLALRDKFEALWNSLNPKYPWESNPWVWVIEWPRYKGGP